MSQENEQAVSMNEIYENFKKELGHYPHTVQQLLSYSKQKNYPYKFVDYNKFWPQRPNPEIKPKIKPVNSNDYKRNSVDGGSKEETQDSGKTTEKKMQIQMKVTMIITLMEMTAIRMKPKMKNQKIIDEKEKTLFGL